MNPHQPTTVVRDTPPAGPPADDLADLQRLAPELTSLGYATRLISPPGRVPCLEVRNPRASILTERVYAQADSYWFSWAERIAGRDQPAEAATILARVLRTVDATAG